MTIQSFASCPLCSKVFQIDDDTPQIAIDGRLRFLCRACRPITLSQPTRDKPNGSAQEGNRR